MKLIARITTALALLAFATPALPCGAEKHQTTATNGSATKEQPVAKTEAAKPAPKAQKKAAVKVAKPAAETKTATAQ